MTKTIKRIRNLDFSAMMLIFKLITICTIFFSPFTADAKNLYVNNSGSPACSDSTTYANNSASYPWCTLLRAVRGNSDGNRNTAAVTAQAAQAGDTVYVTAGTYNYAGPTWSGDSWLAVLYDPVNSGTSEAWITFRAVGTVHLTITVGASNSATIGSRTGQYIEWNGFTINEANAAWRNGLVNVTVNNVRLENNTIIGYAGDIADNHSGIMVHGPRSGDCTGGINNITIRNNMITGFRGMGGRNDAGITLYCLGNNILIENNKIYGNRTGIYAKSNYVDNENIVIRKNHFQDNTGDAIAMQAFSDWHVYQNIMQNNNTGFVFFNTIYYVGNTKPNDVYVVNNTMYGNTTGIYFKSLCQNLNNNHVKNNLIIGSTYGVYTDTIECTTTANMGADDVHFDNNFYGLSGNFMQNEAASSYNWSGWRSTFGQDTNSSSGTDPLFVNAAGGNFRLQTSSSARNAGRDILDLNGNGSTTDSITLGAYITGNEIIGISSSSIATAPPGSVR